MRKNLARYLYPSVFEHVAFVEKHNSELVTAIESIKNQERTNEWIIEMIRKLTTSRRHQILGIEMNEKTRHETVVSCFADRLSLDIHVFANHSRDRRSVTTLHARLNQQDPEKLFIIDIPNKTSANRGYGSIAMKYLFKLCRSLDIKYITGSISPVDDGHYDRLEHFYMKFGFTVVLPTESSDGYIYRELDK